MQRHDEPKILVLITIECLRYDYEHYLTKYLSQGYMTFERAYAAGPYTWASLPAIMSSTYPLMFKYGSLIDRCSISEVLSRKHYMTVCSENILLLPGIYKGFRMIVRRKYPILDLVTPFYMNRFLRRLIGKMDAVFMPYTHICSSHIPHIIHHVVTSNKINTNNFFFWFHILDTHDPYIFDEFLPHLICLLKLSRVKRTFCFRRNHIAPQKTLIKEFMNLYKHAIDKVGKDLREVLEVLNDLTEDYIVIVTGDHGEEFYEHGAFGHEGMYYKGCYITHLYEELIHVPLIIISSRHSSKHKRCNALVSHLDIMPTFLEYVGLKRYARGCIGTSLLKYFRETNISPGREYVITEATAVHFEPLFNELGSAYAIIHVNGLKYVFHPITGEAIYDLRHDPYERQKVYVEESTIKEFRGILVKHIKSKSVYEVKHKLLRKWLN